MTHKIISFAVLIMSLSLFGCVSERYAQSNKDHSMQRDTLMRMTKQDVINLTRASVSDSLIINMMDATDTWFQLKSQDVIDLKNAGVSEYVVRAMMQQPNDTSSQTNSPKVERYYVYPSYVWYGGFYPGWSYPRFYSHHRRFR